MNADKLPKGIVYNDVYNMEVNYHDKAGLSSIIYAYTHEDIDVVVNDRCRMAK